ncbi:hypothetical protein D3C87_1608170 [compost metagenome]
MAVGRAPGGRAEHGAQHSPDTGGGHNVGPARARQRHVHVGGHAAQQHFGHGHLVGVLRRLDAHAKDRHVLVQRTLAQLVAAQFLQQPAVAGLGRRMRVHVDQARHRHQAIAWHDGVGRTGVAGAGVDDGVAAHHQVGVFDIDVRTQFRVPGHQRGQVLEMGDAGLIAVAHGRLSVLRNGGSGRAAVPRGRQALT